MVSHSHKYNNGFNNFNKNTQWKKLYFMRLETKLMSIGKFKRILYKIFGHKREYNTMKLVLSIMETQRKSLIEF